jgi:hypothetical protein
MSLFTATAVAHSGAAFVMALPSARSGITAALPEVVGAILVVFLTLAVGFVIVAYTEATSRRLRTPRIITKERGPRGDLSPLVLPILLLALLVAVSMLMGIDF